MRIRLKVKEVAESKGYSMTRLFKESDAALSTIQAIYKHPYQPVSTRTLEKIANVLGCDVRELIEWVN